MDHIKTPVRLSEWLNAFILDSDDHDIFQSQEGWRVKERSLEAVQAINAYDADQARIAELEAQVKALVRACEALVEANDFDDSELLRRAIGYARAALAQVRVETGDGRQCLD